MEDTLFMNWWVDLLGKSMVGNSWQAGKSIVFLLNPPFGQWISQLATLDYRTVSRGPSPAQAYMGTPPESDFGTEGIGNDIAKGLPSVCDWDELG